MQAVCRRAYPAALSLLDAALKVRNAVPIQLDPIQSGSADSQRQQILMTMIYPPGCSLDNSPLHTLCANDTCSFTWTGADHINQVSL